MIKLDNNSMKKLFLFFPVLLSFLILAPIVEAKVLPQAKTVTKTSMTKSVFTGIYISPKLRADRRALVVYFSNLQNASSVSYLLTYQTRTQQEGAQGALKLTGASTASQELLFGTCSKNVCTYHKGVSNMKLEVSYTTKSGKKSVIRYKIKV